MSSASTKEFSRVVDAFGSPVLEKHVQETSSHIRLEDSTKSLDDIRSIEDVYDRIEHTKQLQSNLGTSDLYKRQWEQVKLHKNKSVWTFLKRIIMLPWMRGRHSNHDEPYDDSNYFTALQFNTLAEGLSSGPNAPRPFPLDAETGDSIKNAYGGFTEIPHPEVVLDFQLRRWRIMEVLLEHSPDIMGLQEVDRYHGFFAPILCGYFGYEGRFLPKPCSPSMKLGWYSDGCALLYKKDTFQLLHETHLMYKVGSQVGLLASLEHKKTCQTIIVGVTHLKAKAENEQIRSAQVHELLEEMEKLRQTSNDPTAPLLILGDFNSDHRPRNDNSAAPADVSAIVTALHAGYQSTHDLSSSQMFTTYKTRGTKTVQRVIDYILYQGRTLQCTHRLSIPKETEMEMHKLPGLRYPSDHVMIAGKFRLDPSS